MKPNPTVHAEYGFYRLDGTDVTAFAMSLFGMPLIFDLERRRVDNPQFYENQGFNVILF